MDEKCVTEQLNVYNVYIKIERVCASRKACNNLNGETHGSVFANTVHWIVG